MTTTKLSEKQITLLPGLMLCLVEHWTHTLNPEKDLKNLSIDPDTVREAIQELIERRYLEKSVECLDGEYKAMQILTQPEKFQDADVLTKRGKKARADFDFKRVRESWKQTNKEAKFMEFMSRSGFKVK